MLKSTFDPLQITLKRRRNLGSVLVLQRHSLLSSLQSVLFEEFSVEFRICLLEHLVDETRNALILHVPRLYASLPLSYGSFGTFCS